MNMKYVVMESEALSEFPVIFPAFLNHKDVADGLPGKAISAGEVRIIALDTDDPHAMIVSKCSRFTASAIPFHSTSRSARMRILP